MVLSEIEPFDLFIAKSLYAGDKQEIIQLLATLSLAAREGDLCLPLREDDPKLPPSLVEEVFSRTTFPVTPLVLFGNNLYFQRFWRSESIAFTHFQRLLATTPTYKLVTEQFDPKLLPEQQEAIRSSLQHALSFIVGGPGTGKTYTAGAVLQTVWNALSSDARKNFRFALAAPTGKAASELQKSFSRVAAALQGCKEVRAETVHSLLQKNPHVIAADLLLVDECSMLDVDIMSQLLSRVKEGARLILLGDANQLPPVEAGSLFRDFLTLHPSPGLLKTCLRAELQDIVSLSQFIYEGKEEEVIAELQKGVLHPLDRAELVKNIPEGTAILTPLRKGYFGVEELNLAIHATRSHRGKEIPLLLKRSCKELNLFNGELAFLIDPQTVRVGDRTLPKGLLPDHELAYVLSVHKSQGSEFDHVILLLPEGSERFGRELLYTAVTRARRSIQIWGKEETVRAMMQRVTSRRSGIDLKKFNLTISHSLI